MYGIAAEPNRRLYAVAAPLR